MTARTTAHYLLEGLTDIGVEYLFANLGTDHVPLIEEMARWKGEGRKHPQVILCTHENLAMHMAMGYAMVTGRGQAVLAHVDVGVANCVLGMHNAFRTRVPLLLIAGKAPFTSHGELPGSRDAFVNFLQEPFDMAGLTRPFARWNYDLPSGVVVKEVLTRAHAIMDSDPKGPAVLTAAREVLMAEHAPDQVRSYPPARQGPWAAPGLDDAALDRLAALILAAKAPVMITTYAGRDPEVPGLIDELARLAGMRVYETAATYLNIPRDSPCFAGLMAGPELGDVDFGLLLDVDTPWVPQYAKLNPAARWAVVDVDPLKRDMPNWGFPADLRLQANAAAMLRGLIGRLREKIGADFRAAAADRLRAMEQRHQARRQTAEAAARQTGAPGAMTVSYVAAELNRAMSPDDILVHETITSVFQVMAQITRTRPQTAFGNGGGGLGIGGIALGVKLARPERTVIHLTGDGSFVFSNPTAMMIAERRYGLPVFTVVLDNGGWSAVKAATLRSFPEGAARSVGEFQAVLGVDLRYDKLAEMVGGHGECVADPAELPAAIARCLAATRRGDPAVLVARVERIDRA